VVNTKRTVSRRFASASASCFQQRRDAARVVARARRTRHGVVVRHELDDVIRTDRAPSFRDHVREAQMDHPHRPALQHRIAVPIDVGVGVDRVLDAEVRVERLLARGVPARLELADQPCAHARLDVLARVRTRTERAQLEQAGAHDGLVDAVDQRDHFAVGRRRALREREQRGARQRRGEDPPPGRDSRWAQSSGAVHGRRSVPSRPADVSRVAGQLAEPVDPALPERQVLLVHHPQDLGRSSEPASARRPGARSSRS
jgi:hypothetical protein